MTDAADFIVSRLEAEGDPYRADAERDRLGLVGPLTGASVGAVRGTVRDALVKFRGLERDDVAALASELWSTSVYECRLAAVVLLQTRVSSLDNGDLTRLEGFVRSGRHDALVSPLATDVIRPLVSQLEGSRRAKAEVTLARWAVESDEWLRRTATLARGRE